MNQRLGQQVNAYQLKRLLEAGDTVEKYLGEHVRTQAKATINLFRTPTTSAEAFLQYAQKLARIVHPHLVRMLDFGVHEGRPFLAVEYFPASLRQLYPPGAQVPLEVVMGYVQQIGSALQYTHDQGEVHGDLRPEHLLLRPGGQGIVISDLGRLALEHTITSIPNNLSPYMGPEQAEEEPQPASDQYALATTITEWLSGERAAVGSGTGDRAEIPEMVLAVLGMGQARDAQRRFKSLQAFLNAFEQASGQGEQPAQLAKPALPPVAPTIPVAVSTIQQPAPSQSPPLPQPAQGPQPLLAGFPLPPPPPPYPQPVSGANSVPAQAGGISRRTLLTVLGIGAGGLALVIGLGVTISRSSNNSAPVAPAIASDPIYTYRGYESQNDQDGFLVSSLEWSPDNKRIISIASAIGGDDVEQTRIWNAVNGVSTINYTGDASIGWVNQTPYAALIDNENIAHIRDLTSGANVTTYAGHKGIAQISWSPGSSLVASLGDDNAVFMWNPLTGQNVATCTLPPAVAPFNLLNLDNLLWSPDGTRLFSGDQKGVFYVWNARSGEFITSYHKLSEEYLANSAVSGFLDVLIASWSPDSQFILVAADTEGDTVQQTSDIHVWNAKDGSQITVHKGQDSKVIQADWSPDSTMIASQSQTSQLEVWDAATGTLLYTHTEEPSSDSRFAWSPLEGRIASRGKDTSRGLVFQTWDAKTGQNVVNYTDSTSPGAFGLTITWSPDGQFIAVLNSDYGNDIGIWKAREK